MVGGRFGYQNWWAAFCVSLLCDYSKHSNMNDLIPQTLVSMSGIYEYLAYWGEWDHEPHGRREHHVAGFPPAYMGRVRRLLQAGTRLQAIGGTRTEWEMALQTENSIYVDAV